MMELSEKIKQMINDKVYQMSGMSYEEFSKLDFLEQQAIIKNYHSKKKKSKDKKCLVMIGSGENATFVKVNKGSKVMLFDGTVVEAGITLDEYCQRQEKRWNKISSEKLGGKKRILNLFKRK